MIMTIWTLPRCLATQRWQVTDGLLFLKAAKFCTQSFSQHAVALLQLDASTGLLIFFFVCPREAIPSKRMLYQKVTPSTKLPTTHADSLILAEPLRRKGCSIRTTQPRRQKNALHTPCRQTGCEHRPSTDLPSHVLAEPLRRKGCSIRKLLRPQSFRLRMRILSS